MTVQAVPLKASMSLSMYGVKSVLSQRQKLRFAVVYPEVSIAGEVR